MSVIVYTQPGCVQCHATFRALDKQGTAYEVVDLSTAPEALDMVRGRGFMQAPVVVTERDAWAGFRPDKIAAIPTAEEARP